MFIQRKYVSIDYDSSTMDETMYSKILLFALNSMKNLLNNQEKIKIEILSAENEIIDEIIIESFKTNDEIIKAIKNSLEKQKDHQQLKIVLYKRELKFANF